MNSKLKKPGNAHPVLWWIGWIVLTILSFFVACFFWTGWIKAHVGPMTQPGVPMVWVAAVFGSWMALLVPLIIVMYNKVDRSYDEARARKEEQARRFLKTQFQVPVLAIARQKRILPEPIRRQLRRMPRTFKSGHFLRLYLKDGSTFENALVWDAEEVVGVYGRTTYPIDAGSVTRIEALDPVTVMPVEYEKWLRLEDDTSEAAL
jgi:hypothetical protein